MQISLEWRLSIVNVLISANVLVYFIGLLFSYLLFTNQINQGYTAFHFVSGAATLPDLFNGEFWRLTASSFLHALSPWHLILNMLALWVLGKKLLEIYSAKWLLFFYVIGGTFGTALSLPLLPNVYTVGASAAVFAFVGVYLAATWRKRYNAYDLELEAGEIWPYALMLFFGFFSPEAGINTWAHIFGFFVGALLGWMVPHSMVVKPNPAWKKLESVAYYATLGWLVFVLINFLINLISAFSLI